MNQILFESVVLFALLLINALLSLFEVAISSARRAGLESQAANGDKRSDLALKLIDTPEDIIPSLQLGITFFGAIAGVFAGAVFAPHLDLNLSRIEWLAPYSANTAIVISVVLLTIAWVILGELVPKRIANAYPEQISRFSAPYVWLLVKLASPLLCILSKICSSILNLFPFRSSPTPAITEEDIQSLVDQGSEEGVINETERSIMNKVIRLGDRVASSIMTPRNDIFWLDIDKPLNEIWEAAVQSTHSSFPAARGTVDNVLGIISLKELAKLRLNQNGQSIDSLLKEPLRIPTTMNALKVLDVFRETKQSLAIVVDEHGSMHGLITLHDFLESLVGSITIDWEKEWVQRSDGSYLVDATVDLVDLFDLLKLDENATEVAPGYHSLGGLIFHRLGHIPREGEFCDFSGFRLEVVDMDGMRIDKVLIAKLPPGVENGSHS